MQTWVNILRSSHRLPGARGVWRWTGGLLGGLLALASPASEEAPGHLENQVKAAFIVKFASFVEWPAAVGATNDTFNIGILGQDPFGREFDDAVLRERVKGRRVKIHRAHQADKLQHCQIVFVADSEMDRLPEIVRSFDRQPVLLVTDQPGAAQHGSMINFFKEQGKVRFEFNLAAAAQVDLRLSAKLLQVGRIVVPAPPGERRNT